MNGKNDIFTFSVTIGHPCEKFGYLIINDVPFLIPLENWKRQCKIQMLLYPDELLETVMKDLKLTEIKERERKKPDYVC